MDISVFVCLFVCVFTAADLSAPRDALFVKSRGVWT